MRNSQEGIGTIVFVVSIALVVGLVALGYFITMNRSAEQDVRTPQQQPSSNSQAPERSASNNSFTITSSNYQFDVKEIRVKKGETVNITLVNSDGRHDWVLDGYDDVRTKTLLSGEQDTVEFVADKAGTFEFYCSVESHRQMGMVGKLIVEE